MIAVTSPPLLPYLASLACFVKGARFVLLVHDVYPEILVRLGIFKPQSIPAHLLDRASRWLYNGSHRILVLGRDMGNLISQRLPLLCDRILIATNWANVEAISPRSRSENALLHSLNLQGRFVVQFWGNMGRPHCIEDLVNAAHLLASDPEIHFLLIGWGSKKAWAVAEKQRRRLENLTVLEPLPRERTCDVQNACDMAINTLASGMSGISVPSRSYNAMAAGKPLLAVCDTDSELAAMVREEDIGWVVPPGRPDLIVSALQEAKADPAVSAPWGLALASPLKQNTAAALYYRFTSKSLRLFDLSDYLIQAAIGNWGLWFSGRQDRHYGKRSGMGRSGFTQESETRDQRGRAYVGDIADVAMLHKACEGIAAVVHAAGLAHVFGTRTRDSARFYEVNEAGTANVVEAALRAVFLTLSWSALCQFTAAILESSAMRRCPAAPRVTTL